MGLVIPLHFYTIEAEVDMIKLITGAKGTGKPNHHQYGKRQRRHRQRRHSLCDGHGQIYVLPALSNQGHQHGMPEKSGADRHRREGADRFHPRHPGRQSRHREFLYRRSAPYAGASRGGNGGFYTDLYAIAKTTDTKFILTVSENEENFPEFLKNIRESNEIRQYARPYADLLRRGSDC